MVDGHLPGGIEWARPRVVYDMSRRALEPVCDVISHAKDLGASLLADVGLEIPKLTGSPEPVAPAEDPQQPAAEGEPHAA